MSANITPATLKVSSGQPEETSRLRVSANNEGERVSGARLAGNERVADMCREAGRDIAAGRPNLAEGKPASASFSATTPSLQATDPANAVDGATIGPIAGDPLAPLQFPGPVSNDAVTITLRQSIGATEPLRTGRYSKVLTFTLSTTAP